MNILGGARRVNVVSTGWINPYITDGLVAMWDGEWNAGGGVHEEAATVWKDLAGTRHLAISHGSFGDNFFRTGKIGGAFQAKAYAASTGDVFTAETCRHIEVVFRSDEAATGSVFETGVRGRGFSLFANNWYSSCWGTTTGIANNADLFAHAESYSIPYSSDDSDIAPFIMRNGSRVSLRTTGYAISGIGTDCGIVVQQNSDRTIFTLRVYSRVLTDTEIAANYAVDKARFWLT